MNLLIIQVITSMIMLVIFYTCVAVLTATLRNVNCVIVVVDDID